MPTTVPHGLRYPVLGEPANGPVVVQNLAQDVARTLPYSCTSATRPAHSPGMFITETDTGFTWVSLAGAWVYVAGGQWQFNAPGPIGASPPGAATIGCTGVLTVPAVPFPRVARVGFGALCTAQASGQANFSVRRTGVDVRTVRAAAANYGVSGSYSEVVAANVSPTYQLVVAVTAAASVTSDPLHTYLSVVLTG